MTLGTRPTGIESEEQSARWVRSMFGRIAPRYDLANRVLSLHLDRFWRWLTVRKVAHILSRPDARVLDLCCGSGDLTFALQEHAKAVVLGSDFCHPMLIVARRKSKRHPMPTLFFEADALRLPVRDESLDLVTAAFGFRNLANYRRGLEEMRRVLRPGGTAAILEFSRPPNRVFNAAYQFYFQRMLPVIGGLVSGSREAYAYLPESVQSFPDAEEFVRRFREAGFREARYEHFTFGIVALHLGVR
jgi:demethylmenaquinone methyltransferase/2-methoxy-6-polyprenyl-1,4-benzoquinol methylase